MCSLAKSLQTDDLQIGLAKVKACVKVKLEAFLPYSAPRPSDWGLPNFSICHPQVESATDTCWDDSRCHQHLFSP